MGVYPTRTIDLTPLLGTGLAGFFDLSVFDDGDSRRFEISPGYGRLSVPLAALPVFAAAVGGGGPTLFLSEPVDLAATPSGIVLVPAMPPGYFFLPVAEKALRVINVAAAGVLTDAPTISVGNNDTHDNYGTGHVDAGAFVVGTDRVTRPALGDGVLVTLADLVDPIVVDVLTAGSGSGGFAWSVRFALTGTLVESF